MKQLRSLFVLLLGLLWALPGLAAFDHQHRAWSELLARHVVYVPDGNASGVRYAALKDERAQLGAYLATLSAVTPAQYGAWSRDQRLAFLINAYNAFTVELILTRYPELKSIKDLGNLFQSPWKKRFFMLLGESRHLDEIEHEMIRAPGVFDEPRIHVGVVCASIGCPMLRNDAFTAERLDGQLDDAMRRFMSDRSRNRFDAADGVLRVSKIFDWYGKDFEQGHRGYDSLKTVFARHADQLADSADDRARIRAGSYRLDFLSYDWALNDVR